MLPVNPEAIGLFGLFATVICFGLEQVGVGVKGADHAKLTRSLGYIAVFFGGFTQLFTGVLTILGTLLFMLMVNRPITLVVVLVTPLSLVVAALIAKYTYRNFQRQNQIRGRQTGFINEMVEGQSVVHAFGREERTLE